MKVMYDDGWMRRRVLDCMLGMIMWYDDVNVFRCLVVGCGLSPSRSWT